MTTFAQRITAAATAFALTLALIAGTVQSTNPLRGRVAWSDVA